VSRHPECLWCGRPLTLLSGGAYVDEAGWFNCAKWRLHWPVIEDERPQQPTGRGQRRCHRTGDPMSAPRLFGRRRWVAEQQATAYRRALIELLGFVTSELDPDPHPWPAYFTSKEGQFVAATLQRFVSQQPTGQGMQAPAGGASPPQRAQEAG
jgi:hypothetical protein